MILNSEEPPKVSIIVINFRSIRQLDKCLKCLKRTSYPNYEVIVVDCLTENIDEWFKNSFPEIKLLHYNHDIGASASHNVGKEFLDPKSKYIVFLDNDAYVTEGWLTELVKAMESNEKIGVAQAKIVMAENPKIMDHAGIAIDALGTWYTLRGLESNIIINALELFASSSAGCIVRRDIFEKVGGFDPDYFIYDDDTDFSFRVRLLGYSIILVPSSIVLHEGGPERFLSPKKLYHSVKNRMCTMLKNYELKNLLWRLSIYITLTFLAGLGLTLIGRMVESREIFKSLFYPLLNLRGLMVKRMRVQSMRKIGDSILMGKGLIRNDIWATLQDIRLKFSLVHSHR
ncbi:glycosyltransferase family 2 protein [Candidatus Bathyarchaeota archaeon]|nr:glycosyltransferase family 2 protein [Candidatus Bathyarchaeota archaeon]